MITGEKCSASQFGTAIMLITSGGEPGMSFRPVTPKAAQVIEDYKQRNKRETKYTKKKKATPQENVDIKPGKMELICGDSLDQLKGMNTDSVDVVVTS
eukprot:SAG22_NODE_4402_length_1281_cov_2.555838_2_plen_97_part_01